MPLPKLQNPFPTSVTHHDSKLQQAKPDVSKELWGIDSGRGSWGKPGFPPGYINYPNPGFNVIANNYEWYPTNREKNNNYFGVSGPQPYISTYVAPSYGYYNQPQQSPFKPEAQPHKNWIYGWG